MAKYAVGKLDLRAIREELHLSQADLAMLWGATRASPTAQRRPARARLSPSCSWTQDATAGLARDSSQPKSGIAERRVGRKPPSGFAKTL